VGDPPDRSGEPPYGLTPLPDDVSGVEGLGSGETEGPAEPGEVVAPFDGEADAWPVGVWPVQVAAGVGVAAWLPPEPLACGLELAVADAFAEAVSLALAVLVALALSLPVALPFGLALALSVSLGLADPPSDGLSVLGEAITLGLTGALGDAVDRVGLGVLVFAAPDAPD
jgi:hypothetical protein